MLFFQYGIDDYKADQYFDLLEESWDSEKWKSGNYVVAQPYYPLTA